jgi:hypothetical protein
MSRRLRGEQLRILLAVIVLLVAGKMLYDMVVMPGNLISLARGGR